MGDQPTTMWLALGLCFAALLPGWYVWRYLSDDPTRGDVTRPRPSAAWRTRPRLIVSVVALSVIAVVGVVAFMPRRESVVVAWPADGALWLLVAAALGGYALFTVARGLARGTVAPLARGFNRTYARTTEPRRFWFSLGYNSLIGGGIMMVTITSFFPSTAEQCNDPADAFTPEQEIAACDQILRVGGLDASERQRALASRGYAHQRARQPEAAKRDLDQAIRLQPNDSYSLFNRARARADTGDHDGALPDYGTSLRLRPDNAAAWFNRGMLYVDRADYRRAISDLTRAHQLDPDDVWTVAQRGISFAWLDDFARAKADLDWSEQRRPADQMVLHGQALLAARRGDIATAINYFERAVAHNPDDAWGRQMIERLRRNPSIS